MSLDDLKFRDCISALLFAGEEQAKAIPLLTFPVAFLQAIRDKEKQSSDKLLIDISFKVKQLEIDQLHKIVEDIICRMDGIEKSNSDFIVNVLRYISKYDRIPDSIEEIEGSLNRIEANTNRILESQHALLKEVSDRLDKNYPPIFGITASVQQDGIYHAKIDEACQFLKEKKPDIAIVFLEKLYRESWSLLSNREKYRLKANIGNAYLQKGDYSKAGHFFLEGYSFQTDDDSAIGLAVHGNILLGNEDDAYNLAKSLYERNPISKTALVSWLRVQVLEKITYKKARDIIPKHFDGEVEIASMLSSIAMSQGFIKEACEHIKTALKTNDTEPFLYLQLGNYLIEKEKNNYRDGKNINLKENHTIEEAFSCLSKCLDLTKETSLKDWHKSALILSANAAILIKDFNRADSFLQKAKLLYPNDSEVIHNYALLKILQKDYYGSSMLLKEYKDNDISIKSVFMLSGVATILKDNELLLLSEKYLDQFFSDILQNTSYDQKRDFLLVYAEVLLLLGKSSKLDEKYATIGSIGLSNFTLALIRSESLFSVGQKELSLVYVGILVKNSMECFSFLEAYQAANLLYSLKLYKEGFKILNKFKLQYDNDDPTILLLNLAQKSGLDLDVLRICREIRANHHYSENLLDLELSTLLKCAEYQQSINLCKAALSFPFEKKFIAYIRTRLAHLGFILKDPSLFVEDINFLMKVDDVPSDLSDIYIYAVLFSKTPEAALDFAYQMYRRSPNNPHTCTAVLLSTGTFLGKEYEVVSPTKVEPNCAVKYQDLSTNEEYWCIAETLNNPRGELREFSCEHPIIQSMIGLKVGDYFDLPKSIKKGKIIAIQSKYIYRWQVSANEMAEKFPEDSWITMFKANPDDNFESLLKTSRSNKTILKVL